MTTVQQVNDALAAWLTAQTRATNDAAACIELKSIVGGNESERKAARAKLPTVEYDAYAAQLATAEQEKAQSVAIAERAEKVLNVLREMLQRETADVHLAAAERQHEAAERLIEAYKPAQRLPEPRTLQLASIPGIDDDPIFG